MSLKELHALHYKESDISEYMFSELINHVSRNYGIPAGKLRPSDRFDQELAPSKFDEWDSARSILMHELAALGKAKGKMLIEPKDIDGYIKTMVTVY